MRLVYEKTNENHYLEVTLHAKRRLLRWVLRACRFGLVGVFDTHAPGQYHFEAKTAGWVTYRLGRY